MIRKLYRIIEKYVLPYLPVGYPIEDNPFIIDAIDAIDEFGWNGTKTIIVYEEGKKMDIKNNTLKQEFHLIKYWIYWKSIKYQIIIKKKMNCHINCVYI